MGLITPLPALAQTYQCTATQRQVEVYPKNPAPGDELTVVLWDTSLYYLDSFTIGGLPAINGRVHGSGVDPYLGQSYTRLRATVPPMTEGQRSVVIQGRDIQNNPITRQNPVAPLVASPYRVEVYPRSVSPGELFKFVLWNVRLTSLSQVSVGGVQSGYFRIDGSGPNYTRIEVETPEFGFTAPIPMGINVVGQAGSTLVSASNEFKPHVVRSSWSEHGSASSTGAFAMVEYSNGIVGTFFHGVDNELQCQTQATDVALSHPNLTAGAGSRVVATESYLVHAQSGGMQLFKQDANNIPALDSLAIPTTIATDSSEDFALVQTSGDIPYFIYRSVTNSLEVSSCTPSSTWPPAQPSIYCNSPTNLGTISSGIVGSPSVLLRANGSILVSYVTASGQLNLAEITPAPWNVVHTSLAAPSNTSATPVGAVGMLEQSNGNTTIAVTDSSGNIQYADLPAGAISSGNQLILMTAEVGGLRVNANQGDMAPGVSIALDYLGRVGFFARDTDGLLWSTWQKQGGNSQRWSPWSSQCRQMDRLPRFSRQGSDDLTIYAPEATAQPWGTHTIVKQHCGPRCRGERPKHVFMPAYHGIHQYRSQMVNAGAIQNLIQAYNFEDHLDQYLSQGLTPVTFEEINYLCDVERPMIVNIDDGLEGIQSGETVLAARGLEGVVFLIGGRTGPGFPDYLSQTSVDSLASNGTYIFQNHTYSHSTCYQTNSPSVCVQSGETAGENFSPLLGLRTMSETEIRNEMSLTNTTLSALSQREDSERVLAYPFGAFSDRVENIVDDYVSMAAVGRHRVDQVGSGFIHLHRLDAVSRYQMVRSPIHFCDTPDSILSKLNYCEHSEYEDGYALSNSCGGGCTEKVCAQRASCCDSANGFWDDTCVELARQNCDLGHTN